MAQESFLVVRDRWDRVREMEQPKAYLFKVAIRRFWRTVAGRRPSLASLRDAGEYLVNFPDPADAFRAAEDQADLMPLLHQLPPRQRQVIWLRVGAGFSEAETAGILSVSVGTVKSQLHEAKRKLSELARKSRGDDTG